MTRGTTTRSGRRIGYRVTEGGPGTPVVLHHGIFGNADHWSELGYVDPLVEGRTVIAIDSLGHGDSDQLTDVVDYRLETRAADTVGVLDELGIDRAHVFGYSLGGWVTCGMARHAPERTASLVVGAWDPLRGLASAYEFFRAAFDLPEDTDWYQGLAALASDNPMTGAELAAGQEAAFRACHQACEIEWDLADGLRGYAGSILFVCGVDDPYHGSMRALADELGSEILELPGDHGQAWLAGPQHAPSISAFLDAVDERDSRLAGDSATS